MRGGAALYALALVANSPAKFGLATIDSTRGTVAIDGPAHPELFGAGDLVAKVLYVSRAIEYKHFLRRG